MKTLTFILLACIAAQNLWAATEIRLVPGQSEDDTRHVYAHKILKLALEATVDSDGPFVIKYSQAYFTRNRVLIALQSGLEVNVHEAPTRDEWEQQAIPIRIPVRKGLLGYRLFLINRSSLGAFKDISSLEELKQLYVGLGEQWTTTKVMDALGFNIVTGNNYEGLFAMLEKGRFDYFSRGVNEIFEEFEARRAKYVNMVIEPTKALYINTPTYFFVSPAQPELADRIERGMQKIINDGTFDLEFNREFGDYIKAANLGRRTIFRVKNTLLSEQTQVDVERFWFNP